MLDCRIDIAIRFGHLLKTSVVEDQVGPQHIKKCVEVLAGQLNGRSGKKDHRIRVIAEIAYPLVQEGFRVPDVVRLIYDHQIKLWWWIKAD